MQISLYSLAAMLCTISQTAKILAPLHERVCVAPGREMTIEGKLDGVVVEETYHKSYADLTQLREQLPEAAVTALAREVLNRLAQQTKAKTADPNGVIPLSEALISDDPKSAAALIDELFKANVPINQIYLEHLSPAAALLGKWWETDKVKFSDVTVGTGRIYAIMRSMNARSQPAHPPKIKSALFAMVPEDDHVLGLRMAVDLARKEGWEVEAHLSSDHDTLVEEIGAADHLLIGLSAGGIHSLPNLARLVVALRISNPLAKILVSGGIADAAKEQIGLLNVDGVARSFEDAMFKLETLWASFQDSGETDKP